MPLTGNVTLVSAGPARDNWPNSTCGETAYGPHGSVECATPVLLNGTGESFAIVLRVVNSVPIGTTLHLTATTSSDTADSNADNNAATIDVYVGGADLDVTVSAPETAPMGSPITYTLTFSNEGPEAATAPRCVRRLPGERISSASRTRRAGLPSRARRWCCSWRPRPRSTRSIPRTAAKACP